MKRAFGDPYSLRWRLAAAIGPEIVALILVIALAVLILTVVWLGQR